MKKKLIIFLIFLIALLCINNVNANERYKVTLNKCVDGDTAYFNMNDNIIKARFLAIDTPESTNKIEEYGPEASEFTCKILTNAKIIEIEYDENSNKIDKYNRELVWIWVDDILIQELILKEGLAEIKYIYGDYKYLDELKIIEEDAKNNKVNIWSDNSPSINNLYILLPILIISLIVIFYLIRKKKV